MDDPNLRPWDHSEDFERLEAIREVVEHAKRITRAVALAKPIESYRSRPIVLTLLAIPSLVLALYSSVTRPEWVYGPDPARTPPAKREAHLRFAMFLSAQRLTAYRDSNQGRLPQSLDAIGDAWPVIIYRNAGGSTFELRSIDASAPPITLRSDENARVFLGTSRNYLRERQP